MACVCPRCTHAADNQLGREHHCDAEPGPGSPCPCQHNTKRYQTGPNPAFRTTARKS